jgi:hypothetical protein
MRSSCCLCIPPIFLLCSPCPVKEDYEINLISTQILSFRLHTFSLPKASSSLKHTSTRRTSGHSLGTFNTEIKTMCLAPLPKCSVLTTPSFSSISVSLLLSVPPPPHFFVFCAVDVVSKKNRLFVLQRTSYKIILSYRLHLSSYLFLSDFKNIISPVHLYICITWNDIFINQVSVPIRGSISAPFYLQMLQWPSCCDVSVHLHICPQ